MSVIIAGIEFDHVSYVPPVDVLYVHVGEPGSDRNWDESAEGDGVSYAADGSVVGLTILNPRWRLDQDGELVFTLPEQQVVVTGLDGVLMSIPAA